MDEICFEVKVCLERVVNLFLDKEIKCIFEVMKSIMIEVVVFGGFIVRIYVNL